MIKNKLENSSFLVLFAGVSILLFFIFAPFLSILSLAVVFAILLRWPYEKLVKLCRGSESAAATLTVGLMLIFVVVPLFFLGGQIFQEAQALYTSMYGSGAQYLLVIQHAIENPIRHLVPGFVFNINAYAVSTLAAISNNLGSLVYQTFAVAFETFLMLLALFFFLRDGRGLLASLANISPLGKDVTNDILHKMHLTIESVIKGTFVNALIRWACISAAFYLFGIPNATLWGSIGGIVGAIPGLGTLFAFVPAIAFMYLQGNIIAAIGLSAFAIAIVILVDNMLTSYFFNKGLAVAPIFVLLSIFGGVIFFGPTGLILGPLVLSVFLSVARTYNSYTLAPHETAS